MSDEGPWVRFFASDWLAGTRGMTANETGVYITLVAMMYERGGPIQYEPARLTRLCGTSNSGFKSALDILTRDGKIILSADGYLSNPRVVEELFYSREKQRVARDAAHSRWHGKANENNDTTDADAMRPDMRTDMPEACGTDANQNQNQKEKKEPPLTPQGGRSREGVKIAEAFTRFWDTYPKRDGANPRKPALEQFISICKAGTDPEAIITGARAYARQLQATGKNNSNYVAQAITWLNQRRWEDDYTDIKPNGSLTSEQAALLAKHTPSAEQLAEIRKKQEEERKWPRIQS